VRAPETQADFGRRHGVSKQCIGVHVAKGHIPLRPDGLIDPDIGDLAAAKYIQRHRKLAPSAAQAHTENHPPPAPPGSPPQDVPETGAVALHVAKTLQAKYMALREKLEYEVRLGQLVQRADVELAAANAARQLRDRLLSLPVRMAGDLAPMTDPHAIAKAIADQIRPILDEFESYAIDLDLSDVEIGE
jgi:hypothetical protein